MITTDTAMIYIEQLRELIEATSLNAHAKGDGFEKRFASECESRGHSAVKPGRCDFDYLVDGLRVQCKCLTPTDKGEIPLISGNGGKLGRGYAVGAVDVFAIETSGFLHLIPEIDLPRSSKYEATLISMIKVQFLFPYRDAWWVLERGERPAGFVRQLPLWSTDEEVDDGR
jgi:hypothetical protein